MYCSGSEYNVCILCLYSTKSLTVLHGCFSDGPGRVVHKDKVVENEKTKVKPAGKLLNYHKIEYLTTEQFESVPK